MTLTSKEILEKIDMVNKDIESLRSEPGKEQQINVLFNYIDYLKDELKEVESVNRSGTSTK